MWVYNFRVIRRYSDITKFMIGSPLIFPLEKAQKYLKYGKL